MGPRVGPGSALRATSAGPGWPWRALGGGPPAAAACARRCLQVSWTRRTLATSGWWATSPCASAPWVSASTGCGALRRVSMTAAPLPAWPAGTGTHLRGSGRAHLRCRAQLRHLQARSARAARGRVSCSGGPAVVLCAPPLADPSVATRILPGVAAG